MKFTKRAYVKVWQDCPIDEREDTTITLLDYEDANELNSIPVALLYLLERYAFVNSMDEFDILEHCLTAESFDLIGFVKTYRGHAQQNRRLLDAHEVHHRKPETRGRYPTRLVLPTLRSVDLAGHHTTLHQRTTRKRRRILEIYKNNPDPLFCHNCGQRFKHVGQDQLVYKHQSNRADILRTLKLKAETQPTFDLAEVNQ